MRLVIVGEGQLSAYRNKGIPEILLMESWDMGHCLYCFGGVNG